ncbi:MAG: hypothetical protein D6722_26025 [Bacteroidetes bacterium]|nr:MAG: hypothetical protein D6722_26025 [Bacteroidota bacterium]
MPIFCTKPFPPDLLQLPLKAGHVIEGGVIVVAAAHGSGPFPGAVFIAVFNVAWHTPARTTTAHDLTNHRVKFAGHGNATYLSCRRKRWAAKGRRGDGGAGCGGGVIIIVGSTGRRQGTRRNSTAVISVSGRANQFGYPRRRGNRRWWRGGHISAPRGRQTLGVWSGPRWETWPFGWTLLGRVLVDSAIPAATNANASQTIHENMAPGRVP